MFKKNLTNESEETAEEILEVENLPIEIENGKTYAINQPNPNSYTHGYFKYPCKFIPEIPRWVMKKYIKEEKSVKILDPFSGSGTTLLEAIIMGHNAYGTEIDSFAKLLVRVKTTPLTIEEIDFIKEWTENLVENYHENFKEYPNPVIPAITNLYHWFPEDNVQKIGLIKNEINKLERKRVIDFLDVSLASAIRKCSNADNVSPKPYVSNKIAKTAADPFVAFPNTVLRYLKSMAELTTFAEENDFKKAEILEGDALCIDSIVKFDIAITSPPYINAFDYGRTLRLENLWLGLESEDTIRSKKKNYVGTENIVTKNEEFDLSILDLSDKLKDAYYKIEPIDKKRAIIVKKFFEDMKKNLIEVNRVLKDDGRYCIVIGDSTIRKVNVESWSIICEIAESLGFKVETYFSYIIKNHYLRIPRKGKGGKVNKDYVFVLKKITN